MGWISIFFFVSGFCSLLYELIWLRLAMAQFGVTTALTSIVLAVFMYFVTPTYFRPMFDNFIGWILIAIGCFMIFIGNLIIRRVVAIEV